MKSAVLVGITLCLIVVLLAGGASHYLLLRRIQQTDLKTFYSVIHSLSAVKTDAERATAIRLAAAAPELEHYDIAYAGDNLIVLHTRSIFSHAYLVARRKGRGEAWGVGWLQGGRFVDAWQFTPPNWNGP